jgi:hypothetical protein
MANRVGLWFKVQTHHWGNKIKAMNKKHYGKFKPTWRLANGRADFKDGWLIKSQLHNLSRNEDLQLARTEVKKRLTQHIIIDQTLF